MNNTHLVDQITYHTDQIRRLTSQLGKGNGGFASDTETDTTTGKMQAKGTARKGRPPTTRSFAGSL